VNPHLLQPQLHPSRVTDPLTEAAKDFLVNQWYRGFQSTWMITYHYANTEERGWNKNLRIQNTGVSRSLDQSMLLSNPIQSSQSKARNDFFGVSKDAKHIRNLLLQEIWGIKRKDKHDESSTPMIFFHEKGAEETQYHTHILLGPTPTPIISEEDLIDTWNTKILPKARCLSRTNTVHVRYVESRQRAIGYLTKEQGLRPDLIDYEASCLFKELSNFELAIQKGST
jgi:hypothetical protein